MRVSAHAKTPKPTKTAVLADRPDNYPWLTLAGGRSGPHLRIQCTTESVAVKISPQSGLATQGIISTFHRTHGGSDVFPGRTQIAAKRSLVRRHDPAELTIGQLHQAVAGSKLSENLAVDHEWMRPRHIDKHRGQILIPGSLGSALNGHRYRASLRLPALQCIETGKGQQRSTAIPGLKCHYGHLGLLVGCEPGDCLSETSGSGHDGHQQPIAAERGNGPKVGQRRRLGDRGSKQTTGFSRCCSSVTWERRGCQPPFVIHSVASLLLTSRG
jgi:hypothetical protein